MRARRPFAFVLMPFAKELRVVYTDFISPGLDAVGYEVRRADDLGTQRNIMRDVVQSLEHADLVVADLTGRNPNVMYEVALAHGLGRPTVLIAQSTSDIPFDLQNYRTILYDPARAEELQAGLLDLGRRHLAGIVEFGSPLTDFGSGVRPRIARGAMDQFVRRAREAGGLMTRSMGALMERDRQLGLVLAGVRPRLAIRDDELLHRVSRSMDEYVVAQRAELATFRRSSEQYYTAVRDLMRTVDIAIETERESVQAWLREVRVTLAGTRALHEPLRSWRDQHLELKGFHERLDRSVDAVREVNDEELIATAISDADAASTSRLAEQRLDT